MSSNFQHVITIPARFVLRASAEGYPHIAARDASVVQPHADQKFVLVLRSWDPKQLLSYFEAVGVVIVSHSARGHAAVAALQLSKPSCVVSPDVWPSGVGTWARLDPDEDAVHWNLAS